MNGSIFPRPRQGLGCLLEFLMLIYDLYAMFVLLFGGFLAHICEMAIDRHD